MQSDERNTELFPFPRILWYNILEIQNGGMSMNTAFKIIGIIYTILGGIFIAVGIGVGIAAHDIDGFGWMFTGIFGGIGSLFFVLGILFLILNSRSKKRARRLVEAGNYIYAEVSHVEMNYHISVNGRHPYNVICRYTDEYGTVHLFRSKDLSFHPDGIMKDTLVRVYVEAGNMKHYYVDIDSILPTVAQH